MIFLVISCITFGQTIAYFRPLELQEQWCFQYQDGRGGKLCNLVETSSDTDLASMSSIYAGKAIQGSKVGPSTASASVKSKTQTGSKVIEYHNVRGDNPSSNLTKPMFVMHFNLSFHRAKRLRCQSLEIYRSLKIRLLSALRVVLDLLRPLDPPR